MGKDSTKLRPWYAVVEVFEANRDGSGRFEVKDVRESFLDAADRAEKAPGYTVAVPFPPPLGKPEVGQTMRFRAGQNEALDQVVREVEWQRESRKDVIVCRMDGRDGVPEEGMRVLYDMGRDHRGRAQDRSATLVGSVGLGQRTEETYYVAIERHPGLAREGTIVAVSQSKEAVYERADERNLEIERAKAALLPDALKKETFTSQQREIAQQYQEEQKRGQGMQMGG
jgi:hypothetical protein